MPALGTDAWIVAADAAARADAGLREAAVGRSITIGQEVVDGERRTRWHLVLDDGEVAVRPGWPDDPAPDVTFSQDAAVADRITRGEVAARTAFVLGQVRLGGDVSRLLEVAPALARLDDVFAATRVPPTVPSEEVE